MPSGGARNRSGPPVQTYLIGDEEGAVSVQCEREQCKAPGSCFSGLCFWTSEPMWHPSPERAAAAVTEHLASHDA